MRLAVFTTTQYRCVAPVCSDVIEKYGVNPCAVQVAHGLYFRGQSSYAVLQDSRHSMPPTFNLVPGFTITIVFRVAALDALLVAAWKSHRCSAFLDLVNGQVLYYFFLSFSSLSSFPFSSPRSVV